MGTMEPAIKELKAENAELKAKLREQNHELKIGFSNWKFNSILRKSNSAKR